MGDTQHGFIIFHHTPNCVERRVVERPSEIGEISYREAFEWLATGETGGRVILGQRAGSYRTFVVADD